MVLSLASHIESIAEKCGGKPCIIGTRIRVWDIHVWHNILGRSPAQIVAEFPQLSVADVHAALAYYLDHREEIERQMHDDETLAETLQAAQGPTRFSRLRDELLNEHRGNGDAVSPG